jgi:DNA-binding transcriptional LysR family regulator
VVDNGGFAPAGRKLGMPKSKLSRRIALLEERLGVRLVQRSTRHFVVTEIGQDYYRHCVAMLVEAEAAEAVIEQSRAAPRGIVRLSCPTALAAVLSGSWARSPASSPLQNRAWVFRSTRLKPLQRHLLTPGFTTVFRAD